MDFKAYKKTRTEAYESNELIIDNIPPGRGGTTQWIETMTEYELNNIILVNNHYLQYENVRDIRSGRIKAHDLLEVISLYGKTHLVPELIQIELGLPPCFCNLYKDNPTLFSLQQKGYIPPGWCKEMCPSKDVCMHKELINYAWSTARTSINKKREPVLWSLPKAYNSSVIQSEDTKQKQNMIDNIITSFGVEPVNLFYDENIFNYIYKESRFTDWQLRAFKDFISSKIIGLDTKLHELWKDFIPIIDSIYNNILMTSIPDSTKIKELKFKVKNFTDSYKGIDFKKWIARVMHLMYEHNVSTYISNPLNKFYEIISDLFGLDSLKTKNMVFGKTNAGEGHSFSYYKDQSDVIRKNIEKADTFILRSGFQHIESFFNSIFPELDDYTILKDINPENNCHLKYYWRYTKGSFPKYVLYQKDFRPAFYNLAKFCKEIVDLPTIKTQKILIILFQQGIKELLKKYFPPSKYENIAFEYWYNLEGKNTHIDRTGVILFGCAGKPGKIDSVLSKMYNIPIKHIKNFSIKGEMNQGMLRIRPNLVPNIKWCIGLTKVLPNGITEYINFNRAEDIVLIPYLIKKGKATANEILLDVYNNEIGLKFIQRKLTNLCKSGLLNRERNSKKEKYYYYLRKKY